MSMTMYDDYAAFCATYGKKYGKDFTVVLIEVGSFWEVYDCDQHKGADMKVISELLNIQVSKKNTVLDTVLDIVLVTVLNTVLNLY
jgi:hypothetical protein